MKCIRCNRSISSTPAATVKTRQGISAWGPVCARRAGLIEPKSRDRSFSLRAIRPTPARRLTEDETQMQLELIA
jgi:hypothetical protein